MADPCWQQVGCPQQTLAHGLLSKSGHHERGEVHDHTDLDGFDGLWLAPTSGGELVSIKARVRSILLCAGKSSVLAGGCCTETSLCPLGASCTAVRTTSSACRCHLTISCEHQDAFCAQMMPLVTGSQLILVSRAAVRAAHLVQDGVGVDMVTRNA